MRIFSFFLLLNFSIHGFGQITTKTIQDGNLMVEKTFHPDSSVYYEKNYRHNLLFSEGRRTIADTNKTGWWSFYHTNEKLKAIGFYHKGKREGYWKFFNENGEPEKQGWYSNGFESGWWEFFDFSMQLSASGHFVCGKKNGYWVFYHKSLPQKEGMFANGKPAGCWRYYQNGKLNSIVWIDEQELE